MPDQSARMRRRSSARHGRASRLSGERCPAIHVLNGFAMTWMPATSAGMTNLRAPLALDRTPADVAAAEAVGPADPVHRRIGARLRLGDRGAEGADVEYAAASGHDAAALVRRAGVKDLHALDRARLVEAFDDRALAVGARIAARRHHHGERRVVVPAQVEGP